MSTDRRTQPPFEGGSGGGICTNRQIKYRRNQALRLRVRWPAVPILFLCNEINILLNKTQIYIK